MPFHGRINDPAANVFKVLMILAIHLSTSLSTPVSQPSKQPFSLMMAMSISQNVTLTHQQCWQTVNGPDDAA